MRHTRYRSASGVYEARDRGRVNVVRVSTFGANQWLRRQHTASFSCNCIKNCNPNTMGVQSNSALASLVVSKAAYDKDALLQWVCQLASPLQLNVTVDKKSPLKLEAQGAVLTARNAVIRAICGIALHGSLDQAPYYLLGGSGTGAALKMGQLIQWMSVADSVRSGASTSASMAASLENHLQGKAFLIGSSQPSLADYDLALALKIGEIDAAEYPAVHRWYGACIIAFQQFAKDTLSVPVTAPEATSGPLIFYTGTEDVSSVLKPKEPVKPKQQPQKAEQHNQKQAKKGQDQKREQNQNQGKQKGGAPQGGKAPAPAASFDISSLDIRVGKIVKAWHHETADKLFCEEIDLGTETRQIASGLRPFYKTEDLEGRMVLVLCNLKKRNLVGFPSHGMVLCASNADHTKVEFVVPAEGSKPGDRVKFDGFDGEPEPENKVAKKKVFEAVAPDLKTDAQGVVVWKGTPAKTEAGGVKALNGMPDAQVS